MYPKIWLLMSTALLSPTTGGIIRWSGISISLDKLDDCLALRVLFLLVYRIFVRRPLMQRSAFGSSAIASRRSCGSTTGTGSASAATRCPTTWASTCRCWPSSTRPPFPSSRGSCRSTTSWPVCRGPRVTCCTCSLRFDEVFKLWRRRSWSRSGSGCRSTSSGRGCGLCSGSRTCWRSRRWAVSRTSWPLWRSWSHFGSERGAACRCLWTWTSTTGWWSWCTVSLPSSGTTRGISRSHRCCMVFEEHLA